MGPALLGSEEKWKRRQIPPPSVIPKEGRDFSLDTTPEKCVPLDQFSFYPEWSLILQRTAIICHFKKIAQEKKKGKERDLSEKLEKTVCLCVDLFFSSDFASWSSYGSFLNSLKILSNLSIK